MELSSFAKTLKSKLQLSLYAILFVVFLKANSPIIVLSLFIVLCSLPLGLLIGVYYDDDNRVMGNVKSDSNKLVNAIVSLVIQIFAILMVVLFVWLLLDRKLDVLRQVF